MSCCVWPPVAVTFLISASDGWAFANNIDINQHKTLEDRLSAAQILVEKEPLCPVVVDDMSNVSAIKYGALPERLYVLQAGKVAYKVRAVHITLSVPFHGMPMGSFFFFSGERFCRVTESRTRMVGVKFPTLSAFCSHAIA